MLTFLSSGTLAGSFGVFAGAAALFFLGEVPRVRRDILQQFPFLDTYFDRPIAPEDNVSFTWLFSWPGMSGVNANAVAALLNDSVVVPGVPVLDLQLSEMSVGARCVE